MIRLATFTRSLIVDNLVLLLRLTKLSWARNYLTSVGDKLSFDWPGRKLFYGASRRINYFNIGTINTLLLHIIVVSFFALILVLSRADGSRFLGHILVLGHNLNLLVCSFILLQLLVVLFVVSLVGGASTCFYSLVDAPWIVEWKLGFCQVRSAHKRILFFLLVFCAELMFWGFSVVGIRCVWIWVRYRVFGFVDENRRYFCFRILCRLGLILYPNFLINYCRSTLHWQLVRCFDEVLFL